MISRREVVTAGVLGTLAGASAPAEAMDQDTPESRALAAGFNNLKNSVDDLKRIVDEGMVRNSMSIGLLGNVRNKLEQFLRSNGRFPNYCDIGTAVFYDVYDWHVKHQQQIQMMRLADDRMAILFMFTQLILRWENVQTYVSEPYDKA